MKYATHSSKAALLQRILVNEPKKICFLFESFMDFLSFMTLRKLKNPQRTRLSQQDYIVLNSVSNIHKVTEKLSHYDSIQCYLDNDDAGRNAYQQLSKELGRSVLDSSSLYSDFKDLNDYLCAEFKHSQKVVIKKSKGIRP